MVRSKTTAFIEQSDFGASISVFLLDAAQVTGRAIAAPVVFKVFDDQEQRGLAPTFEMTKSDAQRFMDELWKIGLRPSEGSGSAGDRGARGGRVVGRGDGAKVPSRLKKEASVRPPA